MYTYTQTWIICRFPHSFLSNDTYSLQKAYVTSTTFRCHSYARQKGPVLSYLFPSQRLTGINAQLFTQLWQSSNFTNLQMWHLQLLHLQTLHSQIQILCCCGENKVLSLHITNHMAQTSFNLSFPQDSRTCARRPLKGQRRGRYRHMVSLHKPVICIEK